MKTHPTRHPLLDHIQKFALQGAFGVVVSILRAMDMKYMLGHYLQLQSMPTSFLIPLPLPTVHDTSVKIRSWYRFCRPYAQQCVYEQMNCQWLRPEHMLLKRVAYNTLSSLPRDVVDLIVQYLLLRTVSEKLGAVQWTRRLRTVSLPLYEIDLRNRFMLHDRHRRPQKTDRPQKTYRPQKKTFRGAVTESARWGSSNRPRASLEQIPPFRRSSLSESGSPTELLCHGQRP